MHKSILVSFLCPTVYKLLGSADIVCFVDLIVELRISLLLCYLWQLYLLKFLECFRDIPYKSAI